MSTRATGIAQSPHKNLVRTGSRLIDWNNHNAGEYAKGRYGRFWGQCLMLLTEATVERMERLDRDVINGDDDELVSFKSTLSSELSMIAVAGAILAQIAVTGLSLPDMAQVHWIARGFFACSLVAGVLSVHTAVMQQRTIGKLQKAVQVRSWLLANRLADHCNDVQYLRAEKYKASFSAAFLIQIPYTMLEYGLILLLVGLGLYFGFAWRNGLDTETGPTDNRNVFIMFLACTGTWILQWFWAFYSKSVWLEPKAASGDTEAAYPPVELKNGHGEIRQTHIRIPEASVQELEDHSLDSKSLIEALQRAADLHR